MLNKIIKFFNDSNIGEKVDIFKNELLKIFNDSDNSTTNRENIKSRIISELYNYSGLNGEIRGPKIFDLQIGMNIDDAFNIFNKLSLENNCNINIEVYDNNILSATSCIGSIKCNKYLYRYSLNIKLFNTKYMTDEFIEAFKNRYNIHFLTEHEHVKYIEDDDGVTYREYYKFYSNDRYGKYGILGDPKEDYHIVLDPYENNDHISVGYFKNNVENYNFK